VKKGEPIFTIIHHAEQKEIVESIKKRFLKDVVKIQQLKVKTPKLILEKLS
jgi:hypothetical protein